MCYEYIMSVLFQDKLFLTGFVVICVVVAGFVIDYYIKYVVDHEIKKNNKKQLRYAKHAANMAAADDASGEEQQVDVDSYFDPTQQLMQPL